MSDEALRALARDAGFSTQWTDNDGVERIVGLDTLRAALDALGYPARTSGDLAEARGRLAREAAAAPAMVVIGAGETRRIESIRPRGRFARIEFEHGGALDLPVEGEAGLTLPAIDRIGYHRLIVDDMQTTLAVAPHDTRRIGEAGHGRRMYGLTAQIYGLRGRPDDGAGHFGAVADLAEAAARRGAHALSLSPAHALFLADENHFTPYSPSSRLFVNALYADPALVLGPGAAWPAREAGDDLVDWPAVSRARIAHLRALFARFQQQDMQQEGALAQDFRRFRAEGGRALEDHARFETLHARLFGADFTKWNWRDWPAGLRESRSSEVETFARENEGEVSFHVFAQWLADRSMARAQGRAVAAGMRIGLISDLAVGMNAGGSQAWSAPDDLLMGLSIGAPPDMLAPLGQNWGLTSFSPRALAVSGYAPFLATLRAALGNAGGVRIDHILGLARLWLVPEGGAATDGVYLAYPFDDLLSLIALESRRHAAIVIGEDLGTVPHGLRDRLARAGVAGLRVFQFERDGGRFFPPDWYPSTSIAMSSTHDTATLAGWWRGADIALREATGQLPAGRTRADCEAERAQERRIAWEAMTNAGAVAGAEPDPSDPAPATSGGLHFLAMSPAELVLVPLEDVSGAQAQPNLPGTTDEHPNWRRRYPGAGEENLAAGHVSRLLELLSRR